MAKMKKAEMKVYRERLIELRARLRGDVSALAEATLKTKSEASSSSLSTAPTHMADIGSDNFERENTLSLLENDGETLESIEAALERIESGTYAQCLACEGKIPKMRLNAIPYTPHCVKCASELQQRRY